MRVGVISEGGADRAVIINILTGLIGIDKSDIEPLRPRDKSDETDRAVADRRTFGGWQAVKEECETRIQIDEFLAIEGQDYIVIHLDTAEADDYPVVRPDKTRAEYCLELRNSVIDRINNWLNIDISQQLLYAIAIEEMDAWVLTIYDPKDSLKSANPKEKLSRVLSRLALDSSSNFDNFLEISKPLSKFKEIQRGRFLERNCSLNAFFEEIQTKVLPKLEKD